MSYITNTDIETRMGAAKVIELTDDAGTGSADTIVIDEARLGAIGEANSYLAVRYAVPVELSEDAESAAVLKSFVLDIAEYRLHARRPPIPEDVIHKRSEAVKWFERIVAGQVRLPARTLPSENPAAGILGEATAPTRTMTRETLSDL